MTEPHAKALGSLVDESARTLAMAIAATLAVATITVATGAQGVSVFPMLMSVQRYAMYGRIGCAPTPCSPHIIALRVLTGSLSLFSGSIDACFTVSADASMAVLEAAMKQTLLIALEDLLLSMAIIMNCLALLHCVALLVCRGYRGDGPSASGEASTSLSISLPEVPSHSSAVIATDCSGDVQTGVAHELPSPPQSPPDLEELSSSHHAENTPVSHVWVLPRILIPPNLAVAATIVYSPGLIEASMAILGTFLGGIQYGTDDSWHLYLASSVACTVTALYVLDGYALWHFWRQHAAKQWVSQLEVLVAPLPPCSEEILARALRCGARDGASEWTWLANAHAGSCGGTFLLYIQSIFQLLIGLVVGVFEHDLIPGRSSHLSVQLGILILLLWLATLCTIHHTKRWQRKWLSLLSAVSACGYLCEMLAFVLLVVSGVAGVAEGEGTELELSRALSVAAIANSILLTAALAPVAVTLCLNCSQLICRFSAPARRLVNIEQQAVLSAD